MSKLTVLLVIAATLALAAPAARAAPDSLSADPRVRGWQTGALRADRLQHLSLGFALALGTGLAADSPEAGAAVAIGLALAKEAADRPSTGFDAVDLAAGAAGAALAAWAAAALRRP